MARIERLSGKLSFMQKIYFWPECCPLQKNIVNAERRGKRQVLIRPSSKVVVKFLSVMQRHGMYTLCITCPSAVRLSHRVLKLGVITAIDVDAPPPVSRFNAPKHERLYPNQTAHFLSITDLGSQRRPHLFSCHLIDVSVISADAAPR